ncbi:MAG TPA: nitronate monooxygenase [Flavobacteriaceae bacterium]|nr:nitronate monooxygenase [Flavobacteriaceae bacterium]
MKRRKFVQYGAVGIAAGTTALLPLSCAPKGDEANKKTSIKTSLCDLLNIQYPIIQAGMADVAGPELVASISNAGGLGILTATMVPPDVLKQRIQKVRQLTDKPFGVNLILHNDLFPPSEFEINDNILGKVHYTLNGFRRELGIPESEAKPQKLPPLIQMAFDVILQENIPVFSIGLGNPTKDMVAQCHNKGIKVMAMVSSLEDAMSVYENGVDIIVAQGNEAGGHRSTWEKKKSKEYAAIGTLPLTSSIAKVVNTPVVAAGGIVNGKGLRAALALGAKGVLIGTRFIATKESMAPESYKQIIIESSSDNTTVTDVFTGMYARVLRNKFTETYTETDTPVLPPGRQYAVTVDITREAGKKERPELYSLYAGQGVDEINEIKPAEAIIKEIVTEAIGG